MKKNNILLWILMVSFLMPQMAFGLATEYERNGEAYLMLGAGPKIGVYRLNNPANESGITVSNTTPLYNPGNSYGVSVNLNRKVFTFSETVAGVFSPMTGNISVHMKSVGAKVLQHHHMDYRYLWGEKGTTLSTTTGPWSGYVSKPSFVSYVTPNASGFASIPNGQWYQSSDNDKYGRPGKCYRDRVEGKAHDYHLLKWYQGISGNNPTDEGAKATSYEKQIARAILGSCIDPCGTNNANMTMPSDPQSVSIALSSMGRTYCYTRTQSSTSDGKITLDNADYTGNIIGSRNDITSKWCGCSLKDATSDYVYVLGTNVIKQWILDLGMTVPAGFSISAITVSDQWNLQGGIVYAYDSANDMVYQFNRQENADGTSGTTTYFRGISLSTSVDDITADGFGNMYFSKTSRFPESASGFGPTYASNIVWTSVSTDMNTATGYIKFDQQVTKSVYKIPLGATSPNLVNSVIIGTDVWRQYFSVPITLLDASDYSTIVASNYPSYTTTADWSWINSNPVKQAYPPPTSLPTSDQIEVGVINVATPPKVYKPAHNGIIDISGPLATPNWCTGQAPQGLYTFNVENSPIWTSDDWNTKYYDVSNTSNLSDDNANGTLGCFVSTIAKQGTNLANNVSDCVLYKWEIWQIQDAYGRVATSPTLVKCSGGGSTPTFDPKPYISHYFNSGVYEILAECKFKWFNYNTLPFGSTILDKDGCLTGYEYAFPVAPPSYTFPTGYIAPTANQTAQTLMISVGHDPMIGVTNTDVLCKETASLTYQPPYEISSTGVKYYIIDEDKDYNWKLKEESKLYTLPNVVDPALRPGTLRWADTDAYYSWSLNLDLPGSSPYPAVWPVKTTHDPTDTEIVQDIAIPTEPMFGKVQCYAYRTWEYDYNTYDSNGFPTGIYTMQGIASYAADVSVMVLDKTQPEIIALNSVNLASSPLSLHGYTGEALDGISGNPSELVIRVRDNNPFGNSTEILPTFPASSPLALFDKDKNISTIYVESGSSKSFLTSAFYATDFATATDELKNYSYPGPSNTGPNFKVSRTAIVVPAGSLYSEAEYKISLADFKYLNTQKLTPSLLNYYTKLPMDFANNSDGYSSAGSWASPHDGYAICMKIQDSSGNIAPSTYLTNIEVADNKAPVVYMEITDMKTNIVSVVPSNITNTSVLNNYNYYIDGSLHTNPYTSLWSANTSSVFQALQNSPGGLINPVTFSGLPVPAIVEANLPAETVMNPKPIESGVEVLFKLKHLDNIDIASDISNAVVWKRPSIEPNFKITGPDSASAYYRVGSVAISEPTMSPCPQSFRLIFRAPGVYKVTAYVEDTAKNFAGNVAHNVRKLEYSIVVLPTTMDIYVIDKDTNRQ